MDKREIYQHIKEIAAELLNENNQFTRADLVYELLSRGISSTPREISQFVYEAYLHYNNSKEIAYAFVTNDTTQPLVQESKLQATLDKEDVGVAFGLVKRRLENSAASLQSLKKIAEQSLEHGELANSWGIVNLIKGTSGIKKSKEAAEILFEKYTNLIDCYVAARGDVKGCIADFVEVRSHVAMLYQGYVQRLIDLFGDAISTLAPEIFAFDSIEFLDVEDMLTQVKLEYKKLFTQCETFMSEIEDSFRLSIANVSQGSSATKSKEAAIVLAAVELFNHYATASDKEVQLNREFETIKRFVKHDVTAIKGDLGRLMVIYKSLNDLFIPKANAFTHFSQQLYKGELKHLFDLLYQAPNVKELVKQREELLVTYKNLQREILDNQFHQSYYQHTIDNASKLMDDRFLTYQNCRDRKPQKPFGLINLITLGSAGKSYRREMFEWNKYYYPVIEEYENYQLDVKLDKDELARIELALAGQLHESRQIKEHLKQLNHSIMKQLDVSAELKGKFIDHLDAMIKVLRIGKDILESKLDYKLIQTVVIKDLRDVELPPQLASGIRDFTNLLRLKVTESITPANERNEQQCNEPMVNSLEQEERFFMEQSAELIQRGINVLENWSLLEAEKSQGRIVSSAYDAQLNVLKQEFSSQLSQLNNEQFFLQAVLKKIHTASNAEQLKEGFLLLLGNSSVHSKEELEQFINGKLKIEL